MCQHYTWTLKSLRPWTLVAARWVGFVLHIVVGHCEHIPTMGKLTGGSLWSALRRIHEVLIAADAKKRRLRHLSSSYSSPSRAINLRHRVISLMDCLFLSSHSLHLFSLVHDGVAYLFSAVVPFYLDDLTGSLLLVIISFPLVSIILLHVFVAPSITCCHRVLFVANFHSSSSTHLCLSLCPSKSLRLLVCVTNMLLFFSRFQEICRLMWRFLHLACF